MTRIINYASAVAFALALCACGTSVKTSSFDISWERVLIDSGFDDMKDLAATEEIAKYKDLMDQLQEIVGYTPEEYTSTRPESGLSNFAADAIREAAQRAFDKPMDLAMTNFGGIRTNLPKGAVRMYDIYSIFPFQNYICYVTVKGDKLLEFLTNMAESGRVEAFSGVRIVTKGKKLQTLLVGGEPVDPERIYNFASIDFLLSGGDGQRLSGISIDTFRSDILIREAIAFKMKEMTDAGEKIVLSKDGRVVTK